ncbi:MAG TPA: hypothetical protein VE155_06575 [Pseudonocardiaceae bacterium]|jgi:hypothetical protein|nr:hypothetical protein [Pseudonocardiaceae bacterium]
MSSKTILRLGMLGFALLAVFLMWSGSTYTGNWLLNTPSPTTVDAGAVAILVIYAAFGAFVSYMRMRERARGDQWVIEPDEVVEVATVLPLVRRPSSPPTQPIPQAPAARTGEGEAS